MYLFGSSWSVWLVLNKILSNPKHELYFFEYARALWRNCNTINCVAQCSSYMLQSLYCRRVIFASPCQEASDYRSRATFARLHVYVIYANLAQKDGIDYEAMLRYVFTKRYGNKFGWLWVKCRDQLTWQWITATFSLSLPNQLSIELHVFTNTPRGGAG